MTRIVVLAGIAGVVAVGCQAPAPRAGDANLVLPGAYQAPAEPLPPSSQSQRSPVRSPSQPASQPETRPVPPYSFVPVPFDSTLPPPASELDRTPAGVRQTPLSLAEVTESVYYAYPGLEAVLREMQIAQGKEMSAWGDFDLKLKAESFAEPLGFYKYYTNLFKVEQPLWQGGGLYGQYRNGSGSVPPWFGELETNDGGEFKIGLLQPLLRNRAIDGRRGEVMQATLRRQQVDPEVQALLLEMVRAAADAYWSWVAAGRAYDVQRELLRTTIERNQGYAGRVEVGDLPRIELVQNERLIASREAKIVEAERKLQQAAIKLSLFLRDERGQPLIPSPSLLPSEFPSSAPPEAARADDAVAQAVRQRPELRLLDLARQEAEIERALGQNLLMPGLDATVVASQDVGGADKSPDNKGPFEFEAGLMFDVPLQRRKAYGKIRSADGKLSQIAAKRRLVEDKIVIEVQDALSALTTAHQRYLRARENTALARQLEQAERERFESQDSDLLRVAIQEAAAIEAALGEIDALADFFKAQAAFRAAVGELPLTAPDRVPSR